MITSISAVVVILFLGIIGTVNIFMLIGTMARSRSNANCCKIVTLIVDIVLVVLVAAKVGGFYL